MASAWGSSWGSSWGDAWGSVAPTVLTIAASPNPPKARVGRDYTYVLTAAAGTEPYTWAVDSGDVPTGLTLETDGTFSGQATTPGLYTFTVEVTDDNTDTDTLEMTIRVVETVGGGPFTWLTRRAWRKSK